jgi:hypothetical protein
MRVSSSLLVAAAFACVAGACDGPEPVEEPPVVAVSDLTWRVHGPIQSLIDVQWEQGVAATGWVEYCVDEGVWLSTPERALVPGPQEALLLGIPYGHDAAARVVAVVDGEAQTSEEITVSTGSVPFELPLPEVLVSEPDRWEPTARYMLGSINPTEAGWFIGHYWMFIVDRQGRVVWAMRGVDLDFTIYLQTSLDSDILWDQATFWSRLDNGAASMIHRMKIDGAVTASTEAPGLHHAFRELPDRSLIWGNAIDDFETLDRRYPDGSVETVWDCEGWYLEHDLGGWCHSNAIFHDEPTDHVLISLPDPDAVIEVDLDSGGVIDWWSPLREELVFDPPESTFWFQHGATLTDDGTLLLSSQATADDIDGVVSEYAIDRDAPALTRVWTHGAGDGIEAEFSGEAHRLPGGNTLHNTGTTPRVREITPEGEVVWDIAWEGYRLLGRVEMLEDLYALAP